ncbi:MAG TPA: hypothetical protein VMR41_05480 [Patescibacteria group bacterium]|nr:hypothetical protein [Patescibacteria group bacterium]
MARAKLGALLNDLAGSVGSATFQNSNAGLILRNKPLFAGNYSQRRTMRRLHNYSINQAWNNLSSTDQAQWQSFANFINIKQRHSIYLNITGRALFYQINFYRLIYGISLLQLPLFSNNRQTDLHITLSIHSGQIRVNMGRVPTVTDEFLILYITNKISKSINNFTNKLKIIPCITTGTSYLTITTDYINIYGSIPQTGETVGYQWSIANLHNGLITPFQQGKQTF